MSRNIQILDTTLRDGEQTSGVSFSDAEKLSIAKLLLNDLKVDRLEIASARVSEGEFAAAQKIASWATENGNLEKIEILGFVDGKASLDWINKAGGKVINLLCKGSLNHLTNQLRKTPEQHINNIKDSLAYAKELGISTNIYLEDWSNGMRNSSDYVFLLLEQLQDTAIKRFMLPDTLGILNPEETYTYCKKIVDRFPNMEFDFHAHNDYDLSVANVMSAVKAGITGIHTTVNGLGERAGNSPLASVIAILHDHLNLNTNVVENKLNLVSRLVESFSGIRIPANKPVIGDNVFTQCAGIHADGDNKKNLYFNDLLPERFGRTRKYALGKTSGKANILKNLEELGIQLDVESLKKVTERIIQLGDQKETVTTEDLPFIISDVLQEVDTHQVISVKNYMISHAKGLRPVASLSLAIEDEVYEEHASGDGQYDAFMKALHKIYDKLNKALPVLTDYFVTIPPGGRTDALVESIISWEMNEKSFKTRGLDSDQTSAAIIATIKMLNILENKTY